MIVELARPFVWPDPPTEEELNKAWNKDRYQKEAGCSRGSREGI